MLHSTNIAQQNTLQLQKKDKLINHEYNVSLSNLRPQCIKENIAIISNEATVKIIPKIINNNFQDKAFNQIQEFESKQQMKKEKQEQFAKQIESNAKKIQQLNRQKKQEIEKKKEEEKQKILNRSKISSISNKPQKKKAKQSENQQTEQTKQISNKVFTEDAGQGLEQPILQVPVPTQQQINQEKEQPTTELQTTEQYNQQQDSDQEEDNEQEILREAESLEEDQLDIEGIIYKQPNQASAQIMIVQEAESEEEDEIEIVDPDEVIFKVVEQVQSIRERLRAYRM